MSDRSDPIRLSEKANLYVSAVAVLSASVWGLFWLPLREIDQHGLTGPWVILAINLVPLLILTPIAIRRWPMLRSNLREVGLVGGFMAAGLVFYSLGLIYTSIMRATMLFYLTPVWSTLFGMVILSEHITWRRWVAIGLGFAGLALMLSVKSSTGGGGLNLGDFMGLLSGIFWGAGAAYARLHDKVPPVDTTISIYAVSCLLGVALLWPLLGAELQVPPLEAWVAAAPVTIAFSLVVFLPTLYAVIWCAQRLSPGRVGILMMSEVLVAALSASLIAGEVLSIQEWVGAALIVGAGLLEVLSPVDPPA